MTAEVELRVFRPLLQRVFKLQTPKRLLVFVPFFVFHDSHNKLKNCCHYVREHRLSKEFKLYFHAISYQYISSYIPPLDLLPQGILLFGLLLI